MATAAVTIITTTMVGGFREDGLFELLGLLCGFAGRLGGLTRGGPGVGPGLASFFADHGHATEFFGEVLFRGGRRFGCPACVELGAALLLSGLVLLQSQFLHRRRRGLGRSLVGGALFSWSVGARSPSSFLGDVHGVFVGAPAAMPAFLRAALLVRLLVLVTATALVLVVAVAAAVPAVCVPTSVLAPVITAILSCTGIRGIVVVFSTATVVTATVVTATVIAAVVTAVVITAVVVVASGSRGRCRCFGLGLGLHLRRGFLVTVVETRERVSQSHPLRFFME